MIGLTCLTTNGRPLVAPKHEVGRSSRPSRTILTNVYASFERLAKTGSEQEFVNTSVFAGFLSDRLLGPPMPLHLLHARCRQCFPTFCGSFHVRTWPQLLSGHNPLKGRLKGDRPVQNSSSQTASLFVRRDRGDPQILRLEIASWTSPSESEPYVCLAALFRVTSPGKRPLRRSRFGDHRLR